MRDSQILDPRPGRRLFGWGILGVGAIIAASAIARFSGADEIAPAAVWPLRAVAFAVGPIGAIPLALLLIGLGWDVLVGRLPAYFVFRLGGWGLITAAAAGWGAMPYAANPELASQAFYAGGIVGSLLLDYRTLDLTWRLGFSGTHAVFGAATFFGAIFGIHAVRQWLFGSLYAAWVARRERTTRHGLKLLENDSGVRCYSVDPDAPEPSVRAKVNGAVKRASGVFQAVRSGSSGSGIRPALPGVVTPVPPADPAGASSVVRAVVPDPEATAMKSREDLAMGVEGVRTGSQESEASTMGLSARYAEAADGKAAAPESLVRDRRPVGRRPAAPAAKAAAAKPEAAPVAEQKVDGATKPAASPKLPTPESTESPVAGTKGSSGGFFSSLLRRGGDTPPGRVRVPDTYSADGQAIPPVPQESRPSNPAAAVPPTNAPAARPAAAAGPGSIQNLRNRQPTEANTAPGPRFPRTSVRADRAGDPPPPANGYARKGGAPNKPAAPAAGAANLKAGAVPGAKLPADNAASDSVMVNPRRPAPPIPANKPAAEKVASGNDSSQNVARATNAPPSSASNVARPASGSASNPIGSAFDELKRELEQMANERDTSKKPDDASGSDASPRAIELARAALAPRDSDEENAPAAAADGDAARNDAAQGGKSAAQIFTVGRDGAKPSPDDTAAAAQLDTSIEQPAPPDWFARFSPPPLDLLSPIPHDHGPRSDREIAALANRLRQALADYGVDADVAEVTDGPVVTLFELRLGRGVKVSKITQLETELAIALGSDQVRVLAPVPGRATVGIEIASDDASPVVLRQVIENEAFWRSTEPLHFALGVATDGEPQLCDLASLPHLLIAGATGTGKSVFLNAVICSILYHMSPEMVRFLLVDPKRVELNIYEDIPHLMAPIVSEPEEAAVALDWMLDLMNERYRRLQKYRVRNLASYNQIARGLRRVPRASLKRPAYLPHIVVVIDELADLILTMGNDVETPLVRLAQMARAVGIHLVVATQRPSVDVITGLIKANFPSRVAFQVSSKVDSRTILDANGAECLRGRGDMLFAAGGALRPNRVQAPFISEEEVERLCDSLRSTARPWYLRESFEPPVEGGNGSAVGMGGNGVGPNGDDGSIQDELYFDAIRSVLTSGEATQAALVRKMHIGRTAAGRLLERMHQDGLVEKNGRLLKPTIDPSHLKFADPNQETGSGL